VEKEEELVEILDQLLLVEMLLVDVVLADEKLLVLVD